MPTVIERIPCTDTQTIERAIADRNGPFIIVDDPARWQAYSSWTSQSLAARIGHHTVQVSVSRAKAFHYGPNTREHLRVKPMLLSEAIRLIEQPTPGERLYIMEQTDGGKQFFTQTYPELQDDIGTPPWVDTALVFQTNLWIGQKDNITPLHFDTANNFLVQVRGRKRLMLASHSQHAALYPENSRDNPANTSPVDANNLDSVAYPGCEQVAFTECILHPTEVLYIPPFWWHQVESLDNAISVNFWWKAQIHDYLNPMGINSIFHHHDRGELHHTERRVDLFPHDSLVAIAAYCLGQGRKCVAVLFMQAEIARLAHNNTVLANAQDESWVRLLRKAERAIDSDIDAQEVEQAMHQLFATSPRASDH